MVGSYQFGSVEIDGVTYDHDVICRAGQVARWWREKGHKVKVGDIEALLDSPPEIMVFGTGAYGVMQVGDKARLALERAGVEVIVERTPTAVERYNALIAEGRDVALAIHLTC